MKINVRGGDRQFAVEIEDLDQRPVRARVEGTVFEVWPEETAAPAGAPQVKPRSPLTGLQTGPGADGHSVLAPLPGTVVQVLAAPGQSVQIGDPLLVIEAMKMKNTIRAARAGTVRAVPVHEGQTVRHHQALVEFED